MTKGINSPIQKNKYFIPYIGRKLTKCMSGNGKKRKKVKKREWGVDLKPFT